MVFFTFDPKEMPDTWLIWLNLILQYFRLAVVALYSIIALFFFFVMAGLFVFGKVNFSGFISGLLGIIFFLFIFVLGYLIFLRPVIVALRYGLNQIKKGKPKFAYFALDKHAPAWNYKLLIIFYWISVVFAVVMMLFMIIMGFALGEFLMIFMTFFAAISVFFGYLLSIRPIIACLYNALK